MSKIHVMVSPQKSLLIAIPIIITYAIFALWVSKYQFQDDAFIHLRIAENLAEKGIFSFNGEAQHFSTSSPLYSATLAYFWSFAESPLLPKIISVIIYLVTLLLVLGKLFFVRIKLAQVLIIASAILLVSPLGIRWLSDGMETGAVALVAILLAVATNHLKHAPAVTIRNILGVALLSFIAVFLRIEFAFILALCGSALFTYSMLSPNSFFSNLKWGFSRAAPFAGGGAIALLVILILFGSIMPDTGLAKQSSGVINLLDTFIGIMKVHMAASLFGLGSLALLFISLIASLSQLPWKERVYLLTANLGLIVFFILLAITHQALQGIRYFIFLEIFLIALNTLTLSTSKSDIDIKINNNKYKKILLYFIVLWFIVDAALFYRISLGRTDSYEKFSMTDYHFLNERKGIAWDVGMVGFFTKGYILDPNGLINGREIASITPDERLAKFKEEEVVFAFVNDHQRIKLQQYIDINSWQSIGRFDFPNIKPGGDTHLLLVEPRLISHYD